MGDQTNNRFENEYASDLDRRLALIVFWPYGDAEYRHLGYDLEAEIRDALIAALREVLPDSDVDQITVSRYQIGPTAEWFPTYLVTIYRDIQPFISSGADLLEWAGLIALGVKAARKWRNSTREKLPANANVGFSPGFSESLLTAPAIEALCYRHFRETYHPRARVSITTSVRKYYVPYGSEQHPSGHEVYTVQMKTQRKTYV